MKSHKLCKNSLIGIIKTGNKERNRNNSVSIKMREIMNRKQRRINERSFNKIKKMHARADATFNKNNISYDTRLEMLAEDPVEFYNLCKLLDHHKNLKVVIA